MIHRLRKLNDDRGGGIPRWVFELSRPLCRLRSDPGGATHESLAKIGLNRILPHIPPLSFRACSDGLKCKNNAELLLGNEGHA
jgi:hypothetical protein